MARSTGQLIHEAGSTSGPRRGCAQLQPGEGCVLLLADVAASSGDEAAYAPVHLNSHVLNGLSSGCRSPPVCLAGCHCGGQACRYGKVFQFYLRGWQYRSSFTYTISAKVRSMRLKKYTPVTSRNSTTAVETARAASGGWVPSTAQRKPWITPAIGFRA